MNLLGIILLGVLSRMLDLPPGRLNVHFRLWVDHIFRNSNNKAWFSNVAIFDSLVSEFIEDTESLSLLCVTQAKLSFGIDSDYTGLLVLEINKHCHGWTDGDGLNPERVNPLWHFYTKALFSLFVMKDSP